MNQIVFFGIQFFIFKYQSQRLIYSFSLAKSILIVFLIVLLFSFLEIFYWLITYFSFFTDFFMG